MDILAVAALDLAVQHPGARLLAEIGVEQVDGGGAEHVNLGQAGDQWQYLAQEFHMGFGETPGPVGGIADNLHLTVDEPHGHGHVVGDAVAAKFRQDRIVVGAVLIAQATAYLGSRLHHRHGRIEVELIGFGNTVRRPESPHATGFPQPVIGTADQIRVQGDDKQRHPVQSQIAARQAAAQSLEHVFQRGFQGGAIG